MSVAVFSRDTLSEAERVQTGIYRAMGAVDRCRVGIQLSDNCRDVALAGLSRRRPECSDQQLKRLYVEKVLGWRLPSAPDSGS